MKKLWNKNRVLFVLTIIIIICLIVIVTVSLSFFYNTKISEYGTRLDDIESYEITKEVKNSLEDYFKENSHVKEYSYKERGRIVYINLSFDEEISLDDAKNLCQGSIDKFEEDILSYYDISFVLTSTNFTIIGSKNSVIDHISWNNNTPVEEESNEE